MSTECVPALMFDEFLSFIVSGNFVHGINVDAVLGRKIFVTIKYRGGDIHTCSIEFVKGESRRILIWIANFNFHLKQDE